MDIKTSCEKCLFAIRNDQEVQTGCELGRLEAYKKKGLANLNGNSYLIDSYCRLCRANDQFSMTAKAMRESMKISVTFIINGMENDYWLLLKNILKQKLMPAKVIVIINSGSVVDIEKYKEYLKYFTDKHSNLLVKKYHFENPNFYDCVDDTINRFATSYYTILDGNSKLDNEYLSKIDKLVNDDFEPLVAVLSDKEYVNTFSTTLHHMAGGNAGKTLKEKTLELPPESVNKGNIWQESML